MYCQSYPGFDYKRYPNGESWYVFRNRELTLRFFWLLITAGLYPTNNTPTEKSFYFKPVGQTVMIGLGV